MDASAVAQTIAGAARQAGRDDPGVRGADWQTAVVTAVESTPGTVDIGSIRARRVDTYTSPAVGDQIIISQSGKGNWLALGRTAASLDTIGQARIVRKTVDVSRASTTTTTDDTELTWNVTAGGVYALDGWLKYSGPGDLQINWTIPTGALGEWTAHGNGTTVIGSTSAPALTTDTSGSAGYMIRTEANDVAQGRTFGGITTNAYTVMVYGMLRVQATGGAYTMQWAQGSSNATATVLYTDSWLRLQRIA